MFKVSKMNFSVYLLQEKCFYVVVCVCMCVFAWCEGAVAMLSILVLQVVFLLAGYTVSLKRIGESGAV